MSSQMKKVLVIAYYWPPAGGPGVQRVLKFVKYLPKFGWQPIVLTVERGEYHAIDESLLDDIPECTAIYKTYTFEPHSYFKKFIGMKQSEKLSSGLLVEKNIGWKKRFSYWIRLNIFIPDAMIGWFPFAVRGGKKILRNNKIDLIFSSGPPATTHLIAKELSRWSGLKWVADFRDPWTGIFYFENYRRFFISKKFDEMLERSVLRSADAVSSVSSFCIKEDYALKIPDRNKYFYIPNGYDECDFRKYSIKDSDNYRHEKFTIMHLGTIYENNIPGVLFKAVYMIDKEKLINENNFSITFVGHIEPALVEESKCQGIEKYIELIPYVSHKEVINYMQKASVLLLLMVNSKNNRGIVGGKIFEYLRAGKPLLVFGPQDGEIAEILANTKRGEVIDYAKLEKTYNYLKKLLDDFHKGKNQVTGELKDIEMYERKNLTKRLVKIFDSLVLYDKE